MYIQLLTCSGELGNCCGDPGIVYILDALRRIVELIQMIVPIFLMICAMIEFTKLTANPDRKDGFKRLRNMFHAAALVFCVPIFVNAALSIMPQTFTISSCWQQAKTVAESSRATKFTYVSPYNTGSKSSILVSPGDYQKGTPKPSSGTGGGYSGGNLGPGDGSGVLDGAERVHSMYEQNKWFYYTSLGQLRWNDIKYSTNNPSRATCCATFVGSALYVGGVFSESELNKYNYNSAYGISKLCQEHGWMKVSSYSQLAAGDVVVMSGPEGGSSVGHVQIYAGNVTWYNAGSTNAIQRANPYSGDASARFLWAWRKPA